MRTLISTAFVSLDGVVEAPGGEPGYRNSGWTFKDIEFVEAAYEIKGREMAEASALMFGRQSYDEFAPVWPSMDEFATYNAMPKYVVSTTLEAETVERAEPSWGEVRVLRSLDDVAALKETDGGPITVHGSATLARSLLEHDLVDELRLMLYPVVLGQGKRLFGETSGKKTLALAESRPVGDDGVAVMVYRRR